MSIAILLEKSKREVEKTGGICNEEVLSKKKTGSLKETGRKNQKSRKKF
jgi:hypothetical protein